MAIQYFDSHGDWGWGHSRHALAIPPTDAGCGVGHNIRHLIQRPRRKGQTVSGKGLVLTSTCEDLDLEVGLVGNLGNSCSGLKLPLVSV